jgi:hypothetical protein
MSYHRSMTCRYRQIGQRRPRGIAVVLVLGLLAITLAISYATLRGQGTTLQLAENNSRALDARVAAQSGLASALRKISENAWAGVDVPISANITNHSWYRVSFTTGDIKIASTDPQYNEYPFRLTIDSIGYSSDLQNPAVRSEHHSRCVVQLVRKKLVTEPANWSTLTGSTVYQFGSDDVYVQFPVRINGSATLLGKLFFCTEYPGVAGPRDQYLSDLNNRRLLGGQPDYRPFPQTLWIRGIATSQDATTMSLLTSELVITPLEPLVIPSAPSQPGAVPSYKLYPGGKSYTVPVLQNLYGNPIQNVTLGPDTVNNPLSIYRSSGSLSIQNNVQITGTVITDSGSDIQVYGTNVALKPFNMPSLYGSNQIYQLPTTIVQDSLRMNSGANAQISGTAMVWKDFEIKAGSPTSSFNFTGNLVTNALLLRGRTTWTQTPATWSDDQMLFSFQLFFNPTLFFPDYMATQKGFVVKPTLTFSPDSSGVKPHWHDWSQPVYQPDPSDPGLKWEVVRWEENL